MKSREAQRASQLLTVTLRAFYEDVLNLRGRRRCRISYKSLGSGRIRMNQWKVVIGIQLRYPAVL